MTELDRRLATIAARIVKADAEFMAHAHADARWLLLAVKKLLNVVDCAAMRVGHADAIKYGFRDWIVSKAQQVLRDLETAR